jgi:MFS family permease
MTYAIMTDLFTLRQRSAIVAVNGMVWLLGAAVGPVMGGLLSTSALWRWYVENLLH